MTTSGTTTFNLDVAGIIEKAAKRVRTPEQGPLSGQEAVDARETLNLVLIDLINKGAPLNTLQFSTLDLVQGTSSYILPSNIVDVFDAVYSRVEQDGSFTDSSLERISLKDYNGLASKDIQSRVSQFTIQRGATANTLIAYPVPENSTDKIRFWGINRLQDVTKGFQTVDLSFRYTPALIAGTAYYMGKESDGIDEIKLNRLKLDYNEQVEMTMTEDRDRSSVFLRFGRS